MKIRVTDIPSHGCSVEFELDRHAVDQRAGGQGSFTANPRASLEISLDNRAVRLLGEVESRFVSQCARCAEDTERALSAPVSMLLQPESERGRDESGDVDFGFYSGEEVDCREVAEESLMLAIPFVLLCREDCRGLCPSCGMNLNHTTCSCTKEKSGPESPFSILKGMKIV